jgi:hypothetical protein
VSLCGSGSPVYSSSESLGSDALVFFFAGALRGCFSFFAGLGSTVQMSIEKGETFRIDRKRLLEPGDEDPPSKKAKPATPEFKVLKEAPEYAINADGCVKRIDSGQILKLRSGNYVMSSAGKDVFKSINVLMRLYFPIPDDIDVTWKPVEQFPGYELSNNGMIRNANTKLVPKTVHHANGYEYASVKSRMQSMHQLVLVTFVGPAPDGCTPNHKNGIKNDNRLDNLEWSNASEQLQHAWNTGLITREAVSQAVIQMTKDGTVVNEWPSFTDAAKSVGVNRTSVARAAHAGSVSAGFRWKVVPKEASSVFDALKFAEPEQWRPVPGYDALYDVSSYGRNRNSHGKLLSTFFRGAYETIGLCKKATKAQKFSIHRLVASAFVPNPLPEKQHVVDHKDGNKKNNHFQNLEWVDDQENTRRGRGKKVEQLDSQGALVRSFMSISDAARA